MIALYILNSFAKFVIPAGTLWRANSNLCHIRPKTRSISSPTSPADPPTDRPTLTFYPPRSLKLLDTTPSRECHKIGVIYVSAGQDDQRVILRNERGSPEYEAFVDALGWPVDVAQHAGFLGGLDPHGATGRHTPYFATSAVEMIFHVATRMPTVASDPQQVHKKRQVGNDHVHIVWSDSSRDYLTSTISSHFNDVHIVIYPLAAIDAFDATLTGGCGYFRVAVHRKEVRQSGQFELLSLTLAHRSRDISVADIHFFLTLLSFSASVCHAFCIPLSRTKCRSLVRCRTAPLCPPRCCRNSCARRRLTPTARCATIRPASIGRFRRAKSTLTKSSRGTRSR
jgi:hypothetical protein